MNFDDVNYKIMHNTRHFYLPSHRSTTSIPSPYPNTTTMQFNVVAVACVTNGSALSLQARDGDIERATTTFANLEFVIKNSSTNATGNDTTSTISHLRSCHWTMTSQHVRCTVPGKRRSRLIV